MFMSFTAVSAQNYNAAVGLEGGMGGLGLTYKQFTGTNNFLDLKANIDIFGSHTSFWASATYDWNVPIVAGFQFFYGVGASAGVGVSGSAYFTAAAFGNIGFEYAFHRVPFAISIDYNPGLLISTQDRFHLGFGYTDASLGVKFTF